MKISPLVPLVLPVTILVLASPVTGCGGGDGEHSSQAAVSTAERAAETPPDPNSLPVLERIETYYPNAIRRGPDGEVVKLTLVQQHFSDEDVETIVGFRDLEILLVGGTNIGDDHLARIATLPRLRLLGLRETPVTDRGLKALGDAEGLVELYLRSTAISDDGLEALRALPKLRKLGLADTRITDRGLAHLAEFPMLEELNLAVTGIDDESCSVLADITGLRVLFIADTGIGDRCIEHLEALPDLDVLDLAKTSVSDRAVDSLVAMPQLRQVNLFDTELSDAAIDRLITDRPDLVVVRPASGPDPQEAKPAEDRGALQGLNEEGTP